MILIYLIDEIKNNFNENKIEGIFPASTEETKQFLDKSTIE